MKTRFAIVVLLGMGAMCDGCVQVNRASVRRDMSDNELADVLSKSLHYGMTEEEVRLSFRDLSIRSVDGPWRGTVAVRRAPGQTALEFYRWEPSENHDRSQPPNEWGELGTSEIVVRRALAIRLEDSGSRVHILWHPSNDCISAVFDESAHLSEIVRFEARPFVQHELVGPPRRIPLTQEPAP